MWCSREWAEVIVILQNQISLSRKRKVQRMFFLNMLTISAKMSLSPYEKTDYNIIARFVSENEEIKALIKLIESNASNEQERERLLDKLILKVCEAIRYKLVFVE